MSNQLFSTLKIGNSVLKNRIVMAPMTRSRAQQPGDVPSAMNARYYAQRASAGLIITEGTQVSEQGKGYSFTPGIYSAAQINGWKQVTDSVHEQNGLIAAQLWHVGRMSHHMLLPNGKSPLAPSAIQAKASVYAVDEDGVGAMVPADMPKAMSSDDIKQVQQEFVNAAINAFSANFDFIEIHAANGYLFDQFLAAGVNHRDDQYGGSVENRARFLLETVDAVIKNVGAERVGVRISPWCNINGMDNEPRQDITLYVAHELQKRNIAYLHVAEWEWAGGQPYPAGFRQQLREAFHNKLIYCGGYSAQSAELLLQQRLADAVAFGQPFIANPDFVARAWNNQPMSPAKKEFFYGGNDVGYTDYPVYNE
ncbi:alkene reductase [Klebsiella sp. MISC125]|uniref:alkene reductase n=1 Tax=Klebsiella sp. MISC125 TaxID=2755386 RepID=UPI003DAA2A41